MRLSSTRIRIATVADAAVLARFAARVFVDTFAHTASPDDMDAYLSETYSPAIQAQEIADGRTTMFLAEDAVGAEMAGFAHLIEDEGQKSIELKRIYVGKDWQGRGLASRLLQVVLVECRRRGVERLWLSVWHRNDRAIAFYKKSGFNIVGEMAFDWGDGLETGFVMEMAAPI